MVLRTNLDLSVGGVVRLGEFHLRVRLTNDEVAPLHPWLGDEAKWVKSASWTHSASWLT